MTEKFSQLLKELKKFNLPDGEYAIFGSGPMAVREIRESDDLDVAVLDYLYKELLQIFPEKTKIGKGGKEIKYIEVNDIEIAPASEALYDEPEQTIKRAELIEGCRFLRLEDLIAWKEKLGREKDFKDIELIKNWLKNNKNEN